MNRGSLPRLAPLGLMLVLTGCAHVTTTAERTVSFAPYAESKISGEPAADFLKQRYGALIVGIDDLRIDRGKDGRIENVAMQATEPKLVGMGSVTMVDRRGYLLTAAHCISAREMYVFLVANGETRVEKARLVWRGGPKDMDLAVLRIEMPLDRVFEWSSDFHLDEVSLSAGRNSKKSGDSIDYDWGTAAGKIVKIVDSLPKHTRIFHQTPIHGGDSGGPLTDVEGKLIGINVAGGAIKFWPFTYVLAIAERPDLAWLQKLIADDFAAHPAAP